MSFKPILRAGRRAAARILESVWALGIYGAGRLVRGPIARWTSPGGERILIVAPHPDDEAVGCVGSILRHVDSRDRVWVAMATDGRQSKAMLDPDQMARRRREEALQAAHLMGVEHLEWMGLGEGEWKVPTLREKLAALIRAFDPGIIYAPSRVDFHPEHLRVAHALALALAELAQIEPGGARLRIYQVQVPLNPGAANLVSDISQVRSRCDAVLGVYASQAASLLSCARLRRYSGLWYGMPGDVEVFWEMSAQRYVSLHRQPPERWPKAFRGLRRFPLTDPLAYIAGLRERRRIANS
jgi:LmbE family N-acetylglucosaminyl deacetylase